jgi:hypothetical protein
MITSFFMKSQILVLDNLSGMRQNSFLATYLKEELIVEHQLDIDNFLNNRTTFNPGSTHATAIHN